MKLGLGFISLFLIFYVRAVAAAEMDLESTPAHGKELDITEYGTVFSDRYFIVASGQGKTTYHNPIPGFVWGALIHLEEIYNINGGLEKGSVSDQFLDLGMIYDTEKAHLWRGGEFSASLSVSGTSGFEPRLAGEVQTVSNIWAQSAVRFSQLAYKQKFNQHFFIRGGILDLTNFFDITTEAAVLLNYAFTTVPTLFTNAFISTAPYWGLALMGVYEQKDASVKVGVFQGNPKNMDTAFSKGYLAIGEYDQSLGNDIFMEIGGWRFKQPDPQYGHDSQGLYGFFQKKWKINHNHFGAFLQWSASPQKINLLPYYLGIGFNAYGLVINRPDDIFSAGIANAWVRGAPPETAYEITYAWAVSKYLIIQPDLQYLRHPALGRNNCLMGLLRIHLNFA